MRDARLLIDTLRLAPPPDADALAGAWSRADSAAVVRLVGYEGAALWLQRRLKDIGVVLADDARASLAALVKHSAAQSLRVDAESFAALHILDSVGIAAVPLKAAAMRRLSARVPYADARSPNDVDLLVREDVAERAWNALVARGYSALIGGPPDHHHLPALVGAMNVGVEIHTTTVATVSAAESWRRATSDGATADFEGRSRPIPSDTELLWHLVAHALVTADEVGRDGLRLRYWLDAAALLAAGAEIDWERLRARLDSTETPRPQLARAWLHTASDLSGHPLPVTALGGAPASALDLERLLSWRLRVFARGATYGRWSEKLMEEGARGEGRLPHEPVPATAATIGRLRHAFVARAARLWWTIRR